MSFWPRISGLQLELIAYARSLSQNVDDAEDLVSTAIERAAKSEQRPSDKTSLKFWLFRIMKNAKIDQHRKEKVEREYSGAADRSYGEALPAIGLDEKVLIRQAFEKLPSQKREILYLVDVLGMKYDEAAEKLGVPVGTIMSRVARARRDLLNLVDPDHAGRESNGGKKDRK